MSNLRQEGDQRTSNLTS